MNAQYYEKEMPDPDFSERFAEPGGEALVIDIFIPDKFKHNKAAVICVHGGGWNAGSRDSFLWHAHRLSLHGYVACTIDYRLSKTASYPAAVEDCQAAVRWMRENASRFGICDDRIGAIGSSAGGHLVACLGVFEETRETVSSRVNCVVDIHGVHDFISLGQNAGKVNTCTEDFIGDTITKKRGLWEQASPALYVDSGSAPMLLVHDPSDKTVPYDQSLIMANSLMKAGHPVQFLPSPGSGHGFVYNPQNEWTQRIWPVANSWFDYHLLGKTSNELL